MPCTLHLLIDVVPHNARQRFEAAGQLDSLHISQHRAASQSDPVLIHAGSVVVLKTNATEVDIDRNRSEQPVMMVPSFLYSALDMQTLRMAEELALLGGGDCKAVNMEVHCIVDDRLSKLDNQIIRLNDESVTVKDALQSSDVRYPKCMRDYRVSSTSFLHDVLQSTPENFTPLKYVLHVESNDGSLGMTSLQRHYILVNPCTTINDSPLLRQEYV